jgi:hypothetical protein
MGFYSRRSKCVLRLDGYLKSDVRTATTSVKVGKGWFNDIYHSYKILRSLASSSSQGDTLGNVPGGHFGRNRIVGVDPARRRSGSNLLGTDAVGRIRSLLIVNASSPHK